MSKAHGRISRGLVKALGGVDPDAPPVNLPPPRHGEVLKTVRIPVPTAKAATAVGLAIVGQAAVYGGRWPAGSVRIGESLSAAKNESPPQARLTTEK